MVPNAEPGFKHAGLTDKIIKVLYDVYNELGVGFLESVYEAAVLLALRQAGLTAHAQLDVHVHFRGERIADFRADIVVEGVVLPELKAGKGLDATHEAQVLNYLRATPIEVALLVNFGPKLDFRRFAFDNHRKRQPATRTPFPPPS